MIINIPKSNNNASVCHCASILHINIIAPHQRIFRKSNTFLFSNENSIVIPPKQFYRLPFTILVETSLPALCILFAESMLLRQNIFHEVTLLKTNDQYFYITLFNNNNHVVQCLPDKLQFNCIIIQGNFFEIY